MEWIKRELNLNGFQLEAGEGPFRIFEYFYSEASRCLWTECRTVQRNSKFLPQKWRIFFGGDFRLGQKEFNKEFEASSRLSFADKSSRTFSLHFKEFKRLRPWTSELQMLKFRAWRNLNELFLGRIFFSEKLQQVLAVLYETFALLFSL